VRAARAGRDVEPPDDEPGDEERHRVEVDRDDDGVEPQSRGEVVDRARDEGHAGVDHRGDRRRPVRGHQADLVRGLEPLRRHQIGDRGVLGRHPEQGHALDQDRRGVEPGQRAYDRDGQEQRTAQDVPEHERPAPVQAVGDGAGQRPQQHRRRQAKDEDAGDGEVLSGVGAARQVLGEGGCGEQAQPVPEAGAGERQPQLPERLDPQDRTDVVLGRGIGRPVAGRVRGDGVLVRHGAGRRRSRCGGGQPLLRRRRVDDVSLDLRSAAPLRALRGGCRPPSEAGQMPGHAVSVARGPGISASLRTASPAWGSAGPPLTSGHQLQPRALSSTSASSRRVSPAASGLGMPASRQASSRSRS
jgi:hypothetical protein